MPQDTDDIESSNKEPHRSELEKTYFRSIASPSFYTIYKLITKNWGIFYEAIFFKPIWNFEFNVYTRDANTVI